MGEPSRTETPRDRPRSATYVAIVPEGVDFDWCPQGCGGTTEDPYGGPCKACWREIGNGDGGRHW